MNWKESGRSGHAIMEVKSWNLPEELEEHHQNTQSGSHPPDQDLN
jgi:hypothetical protein